MPSWVWVFGFGILSFGGLQLEGAWDGDVAFRRVCLGMWGVWSRHSWITLGPELMYSNQAITMSITFMVPTALETRILLFLDQPVAEPNMPIPEVLSWR